MIRPLAEALERFRDRTRPLRRRFRLKDGIERVRSWIDQRKGRKIRDALKVPVIGITGSSGKSTTTALLSHILQRQGRVASLVIGNTKPDLIRFLAQASPDVDFVLAEMGVTVKGSMAPMVAHLRPTVAIVTKVGIEHYSAFRSRDAVATEKGNLVSSLPDGGLAILNCDDPHVAAMALSTRARVITFGRSEAADYRVVETSDGLPARLAVTISCRSGTFRCQTRYLDDSFWLAATAAFACAVELGVAPEVVVERMATAEPIWTRMQIMEVAGGTTFILDTAKAPAETIAASIAVLRKAKAERKTLVLGSISDYAGNPRKQYRASYRLGRQAADRTIFVGHNSHRSGATPEDIAEGRFSAFLTPKAVADCLRGTVQSGELILVKGSRNLHLERIALSFVQPVRCWEPQCGKYIDCLACGRVQIPFEEHGKARRAEKRARLRFWRK